MTVEELVEKLQELPDDLEVWLMGSHYAPLREVEVLSDFLRGEEADRVVLS